MCSPQLCQTCRDCFVDHAGLFKHVEDRQYMRFSHHFASETLEASAAAKCPICVLLWTQLQQFQPRIKFTSSQENPLTMLDLLPQQPGPEGSYLLLAEVSRKAIEGGNGLIVFMSAFVLHPPQGSTSCSAGPPA
jgi:hypothetical protein